MKLDNLNVKKWNDFIIRYPLLHILIFILFYAILTLSITTIVASPEYRIIAIAVTLNVGRIWYVLFLRI